MPGRGMISRRTTDLAVVVILYCIILAGSYAYVYSATVDGSSFPSLGKGFTGAMLALTPLALLALLAFSLVRFIGDYRRKVWGSRIRARVMLAFIAVCGMAAGPSVILMGAIAIHAVASPSSATVSSALHGGLDLALTYYAEKEAELTYAAENDVAAVVAARGPDAERVLARLSARDPAIRAVELFSAGQSVSFAGDQTVRSGPGNPSLERSGFLPRLSAEGGSYARYFARDASFGSDGARVSAIVSMRFDPLLEETATGLSHALIGLEESGRIAGSFPLYLAFFTSSIVAPLLAITLLFAQSISDRIIRPLGALSEALLRVGAGARRAPFLSKPGDEAGELVESLNVVLENLEKTRGDELRNEKIGAWRDIARKLAHELRNPLTPIRLSAERVLRRWKSDPAAIADIIEKSMVAIVQETANMEALLTEFRDFARLPEPQKDWMNLKETIEEAVHLYSASWPSLVFDCEAIDQDIVLKADRGYLKQALGNLIANAADATEGSGRIWIRADLVKTAESRYCRVQVRDDGRGIPEKAKDDIFSPYFTTKPGGTGLGLAIVDHIVAAHGGRIRFESQEGVGTVFYIDLPAEQT